MTYHAPDPQSGNLSTRKKAVIGVGALFALLASCGIGSAMGGDEPAKAAAPSTVTTTRTATETVTVTKTPTRMRAATTSEPTTTPETTPETTTETTPELEPERTTQRVVPLVPRTTEEAPSAYYSNCSAARAAGAAPLYRGSPGYGTHLDRDGDGVACE